MAGEIIIEGDDEAVVTPAEQSAHEAAVAEGATAVHGEIAAQAAEEAKEAASIALDAAKANMDAALPVAAATEQAQAAAQQATVSAEMVHDALAAQTAAITALTEELRNSRKQAPQEGPAKKPPGDRPPGERRTHGYYAPIGRGKKG